MRILVVGGGAREHALCLKLSQEAEVFAAPGNPGIAAICETRPVRTDDHEGLARLCAELRIELVVVGPEGPLIAGLGDTLRERGYAVFGPGAAGARLEASKEFSKALMVEAGVPTAAFETFTEAQPALNWVARRYGEGRAVVVKASGEALGKGAVVCPSREEAEKAVRMMLVERELGPAADTVIIEDLLEGREFSLLTLCSDRGFRSIPVAQDYKRALDDDRGPNTGGMGSHSPVAWVDQGLVDRAEQQVVAPLLEALRAKGIPFRGLLFSGLMVREGMPCCLEYNVRFGDPETQSIMLRLGGGLAEALAACARGGEVPEVEVLPHAAVSVVVASRGYPGKPFTGAAITVPEQMPQNVALFHAGTALAEGRLVNAGGRVFTVSATGDSQAQARERAYAGVEQISFEGAWCRSDIAAAKA